MSAANLSHLTDINVNDIEKFTFRGLIFDCHHDCNYRKFDNCIHLLDTFKPAVKQCEHVVRHFKWKSSPIVEKIVISAAMGDNFKNLQRKANDFLVCRYVKRKQAAHLKKLIVSCDG